MGRTLNRLQSGQTGGRTSSRLSSQTEKPKEKPKKKFLGEKAEKIGKKVVDVAGKAAGRFVFGGGLPGLAFKDNIKDQVGTGGVKGLGSTMFGVAELASKLKKGRQEPLQKPEFLVPQGPLQKLGYGAEQIGEFIAPGGLIGKAVKGAEVAAGAGKLGKLAGFVTRLAGEGISAGAITAAQTGGDDVKAIKRNVALGVAFPIAGRILNSAFKIFGKGVGSVGQKIQTSIIKPSAADVRDGFNIQNVNKYNLGGSLNKTLTKTQSKLQELSDELYSKIRAGDADVNLNDVYIRTAKQLQASGDKLRNFGNVKSTKRVLDSLIDEIKEASPKGIVSLPDAQLVKQGAGLKGAWVFGSADPDASAVEKVYNAFYRELKKEIEKVAPAGVRQINKQISELIPISNAVIRRIPVAERNAVLSLGDLIGLATTALNPKGGALLIASRLSKSGSVGNAFTKLGQRISNVKPKSGLGKRIFGQ